MLACYYELIDLLWTVIMYWLIYNEMNDIVNLPRQLYKYCSKIYGEGWYERKVNAIKPASVLAWKQLFE